MKKSNFSGHLSIRSAKAGAATVSAMWLIIVGVLFLVGLFYGYTENEAATLAKADAAAEYEARLEADKERDEAVEVAQSITAEVGFNDRSTVGSLTNVELAAAGLKNLTDAIPMEGTTVETFEDVIAPVISAYNAKLQEIQNLQTQLADARRLKDAAETSVREVTSTKDDEIRNLQQQLADLQSSARDQQQALEDRVAQAQSARDQKDQESRQARSEVDNRNREISSLRSEHETRTKHLSSVLKFQREPEAPDGKILAASESLPLGWINVGAKDRVHRGMRFNVVSGRAGTAPDSVKAIATVTNVEPDKAEVQFSELADRFDPVVKGDIIYNPLFDPKGGRNAFLLGRFTGAYSEKELRLLLKEIGINVQPRLDSEVDYLLVGQEVWTDEDGEHLEEPILPSDMPEYKEAESMGVQIVTLRDIVRFFKK